MNSASPCLLLLEPRLEGHHGVYLQWILRGAIRRGYYCVLATEKDSAAHPLFPSLVEESGIGLKTIFFPEEPLSRRADTSRLLRLIRRDLHYRQVFRSAYRQISADIRPDVVLLPYLDYGLYSIAVFGSPFGETPWGGIAMRPAFHLSTASGAWMKKKLFFHMLRSASPTRLFVMDEHLYRFIGQSTPALLSRCRYLAPPAEMNGVVTRTEARRSMGIPDAVMVILLYGTINRRKGLDILLKVMEEPEFPAPVHVILAGRQDAEAESILAASPARALLQAGRLHVRNHFLSRDEEYCAFAAADLLWMGYREHVNTSGVMVQGGQMGLPMLGCDDGSIGRAIRERQLGIILPLENPGAAAGAIRDFIRDPERMRRCGENGRRFFAAHTPDQFAHALFAGMTPCPGEGNP